jgi:hypothetical protein
VPQRGGDALRDRTSVVSASFEVRECRAPGPDRHASADAIEFAGTAAGGVVILPIGRRRLPRQRHGRTARAAFAMLPPDIQASVRAALAEREESDRELGGQRADPRAGARNPARVPASAPYLFVVRSGAAPVFSSLRGLAWSCPDLLGVVFDRRWMGDRRARHQPVRPERRRDERRRGAPDSSWDRRGFLLVRASPRTT